METGKKEEEGEKEEAEIGGRKLAVWRMSGNT